MSHRRATADRAPDTLRGSPVSVASVEDGLPCAPVRLQGPADPYDPVVLVLFRRVLADTFTWTRSKVDKTAWAVGGDTWLFVSLALAVAPTVNYLRPGSPWLPILIGALGVVGTVASLSKDVWNHLGRLTGWETSPLGPPFKPRFPVVEPNLPTQMSTPLGSVFTSREVNATIGETRTEVERRTVAFQLDGWLRAHASTLMRKTGPSSPFNGRCVRLDTDIHSATLMGPTPVGLRPARYFQALSSNQLTTWRITREGELWPFHDRYLFEPQRGDDEARALVSFGASQLANIIGVSTLAVTTDDQLVVVLQSRKSGSSSGRWAPSGSGSLDPEDMVAGDSLQDVVLRGALRELREECVIADDDIVGSRLIGYGRWLDHGGKPEFIAVTALDIHSSMIRRKPRWRITESAWTQVVKTVPLPLKQLAELPEIWQTPELLASRLTDDADLEGSSSLPLEFGLRCLADALRRDPMLVQGMRRDEALGVTPA